MNSKIYEKKTLSTTYNTILSNIDKTAKKQETIWGLEVKLTFVKYWWHYLVFYEVHMNILKLADYSFQHSVAYKT